MDREIFVITIEINATVGTPEILVFFELSDDMIEAVRNPDSKLNKMEIEPEIGIKTP